MGIEIERKFLLRDDSWRDMINSSERMKQGYLSQGEHRSIRVRVSGDNRAWLNIKSSRDGINRLEFEYPLPVEDAEEMLAKVAFRPFIDKTRHYIKLGKHTWEVDEFYGENQGLIVAEIELDDADENFQKPDWLGEEVSSDPRYYNSNLIKNPFNQWSDEKN
jgi:adenylate cyclase